MTEQRIFSRLEDFMSIAKKGEKVDLTVVLNTRSVRAKFPFYTRKFDPSTIGIRKRKSICSFFPLIICL